MKRTLAAITLLALAGIAQAQSSNCSALGAPALPVQPTVLPALAPELTAPSHQLGAPTGVLAQAFDETQSIDNVLFRIKLEGCRSVANAVPAPSPGAAPGATPPGGTMIDAATYKPQTQFDNTPWRFDMNQNGKRMTAEEFDAWMKARGVRVAKGNGAAAPATTPSAAPAGTAPGTQPAPATAPPKTPDGKQ
jgi:hypothetical protein